MEMEACQKIDLEFEDDGLIDDKMFSGGLLTENEGDDGLISEFDNMPEMCESAEPQQNQKNGRYNLRKSLAWDSAFFTSAGVLDAEELSTIMTGADKGEKHMLPGIEEEITGSTESLSTLGSDTLTMETIEEDLFVDIRASIQRSSKKALNLRMSNSEASAVGIDSTAISSLKKEDTISQITNQKPGLKKTSSLSTIRMSKCREKQNIGKLETWKATKQDYVHSQVKQGYAFALICCASSLLFLSTKGTQPTKVLSSLGGARRASSSGSSLLPSSTQNSVQSRRSSTSSNSSSNISSKINPVKSNLMPARRNTGKTSNIGTGPSASIPKKVPSRATPKTKLPSTLSKISSNVSPARSISEWSSVSSSSSSSMVSQKFSNSANSIDTSSCRSADSDLIPLDPTNPSVGETADGPEYHEVILTSENSKKPTSQTGGKLHTPGKPSGLRMPAHKFGFFDGVKSSVNSPNRHQQQSPSAVQNKFPKNGPSSIGIPVRSSISKLKTVNAKVSTPKTVTFQIQPISSRDEKSTDIKDSPNLCLGVEVSIASEGTFQDQENAETEDRAEQVFENTGAVSSIKESLDALKIEGGDVAVNENCRVPLAPVNSFVCSENADVAKESVVQVVDKAGIILPAFQQKENC
ncbi:protein kinase protein with adenine nucleotidealpha hydrolases-like domain [Striga asiatica]|uniref:Protein kinase protein with adenine nucleotidealpha hydrolases-like domain n=1 Tax=Striga asiatica TaxID=4170 RepID=A0A5A7RJI7_STRAF|nr:protein kinase protein with adenine nucleotidealpha hydrolases-like domain [Striga asiatica]